MKLIEKLAEEWFEKEYGPLQASGFSISSKAFQAGFRACREMIRQKIKAEIGSDEALNTIGFPIDLGESEVS